MSCRKKVLLVVGAGLVAWMITNALVHGIMMLAAIAEHEAQP